MYFVVNFITLFVVWIFISGKLDPFHLSLGAISCLIVALVSTDLLYTNRQKGFASRIGEAVRFISYTVWLMYQIVRANFHVTKLALSLKPMERTIDPCIFTFQTNLKTDFGKFILANSITLTPGTVTIRIQDDTFYVHAITRTAMGDFADNENISEMEKRIAWIFEGGSR